MRSFHDRRGQGEKLDLLLRMQEHCFLIAMEHLFDNTWTGNTHEETDVLPSARWVEGNGQQVNLSTRDVRGKTSLVDEEMVSTNSTLIDKRLG